MILGNIQNALRFALDAQKDYVYDIPEWDLRDMAEYLSNNFDHTYRQYHEARYGIK